MHIVLLIIVGTGTCIYIFMPIGNEPAQDTNNTSNGDTKHQLDWPSKYTEYQITY